MNSPTSCLYEFEGFVLDPQQRLVRAPDGGRQLRLSARAFDALHLLLQHHGQLVAKETLIKALWPNVVVEDNNLTQVIHSLRQALGEKPGEHRFIATAPGRGYQFVAPVKELPRSTSTATTMDTSGSVLTQAPIAPIKRRSGSTIQALVRWGAPLLVVIVMTAAWWLAERDPTSATDSQQAAQAEMPHLSIAVLPFINLTGDPDQDYLGDGMAEELINTLNRVPGLKVPARTSTFAYKNRSTDIRQIGKDLGVSTILEGSVRAADKHIRIAAQLISAQDGLTLWSGTYDEEFTDIFKLQGKLATEIAKALQPNLSASAQAALKQAPPTQDIEAYQRYLQASSLMDKPAIELLSQAVARDPNFAQAYGKLAVAHMSLYLRGYAAENSQMALKFAQQALSFGPNAPAQSVLTELSLLAGDWKDMDTRDNAILALPGADASLIAHRSMHLIVVGKLRAAVENAQHAYNLAPAAPRIVSVLARTLSIQGREAEAMRLHDLAVTLGLPRSEGAYLYAKAARNAGDYPQSADLINASFSQTDIDEQTRHNFEEAVRLVHAALADPAKRAAALNALRRTFPLPKQASSNPIPQMKRCMTGVEFHVWLRAMNEAYALAMQCTEIGSGMAVAAAGNGAILGLRGTEMSPFRRDPRFQAFATRIGLMEYWQQSGPPDDCELVAGKLRCH